MSGTLLDLSAFYQTLYIAIDQNGLSPTAISKLREDEIMIYKNILELKDFVVQTKAEPRLRGPFPDHVYASVIDSCTNIFDALIVLRSVIIHSHITVDVGVLGEAGRVRRDLRDDLIGNVVLTFHVKF